METQILGYLLAGLVGISLGLMGSGGSILTVPILVYVLGLSPLTATAYSLFIVGISALTGTLRNAVGKSIAYHEVIVFGAPSVAAVFLTRLLVLPAIPDSFPIFGYVVRKEIFIMLLFAMVMITAAYSMLTMRDEMPDRPPKTKPFPYIKIVVWASGVGVIAGLVGAGGGFLIVPSLMILANLPVKRAIATSLMIVAIQSLLGFAGDVFIRDDIDWKLILTFSACSIGGIFIGLAIAQKVHSKNLKKLFGYFVLAMGVYIIVKELWL